MKRNNTKAFFSVILCAGMLLSSGFSHAAKPTGLKELKSSSKNVFVPEKLGRAKLSHNGRHFQVKRNGKRTNIQNCFVDKSIRNISKDRLAKLMGHGYLSLNQTEDGEYTLKSSVRGNGGGPLLGGIVVVGIKSIGYGALAAGMFFAPLITAPLLPSATASIEIAATGLGAAATLAPTL